MSGSMSYHIEYRSPGEGEKVITLGAVGTRSAQDRARKLSQKDGELGAGLGQSVYLIGTDGSGDMMEHYNYFGGSLVEKDLVKDWKD